MENGEKQIHEFSEDDLQEGVTMRLIIDSSCFCCGCNDAIGREGPERRKKPGPRKRKLRPSSRPPPRI